MYLACVGSWVQCLAVPLLIYKAPQKVTCWKCDPQGWSGVGGWPWEVSFLSLLSSWWYKVGFTKCSQCGALSLFWAIWSWLGTSRTRAKTKLFFFISELSQVFYCREKVERYICMCIYIALFFKTAFPRVAQADDVLFNSFHPTALVLADHRRVRNRGAWHPLSYILRLYQMLQLLSVPLFCWTVISWGPGFHLVLPAQV